MDMIPMTDYITIKLPKDLVEQIDEVLEKQSLGYASRTEIVKDALRGFLAKIKRIESSHP
jgi:metal-responsive CopG/Arc/MetJ family transcriptional regulator